jgi:Cyclin C-terminal domain
VRKVVDDARAWGLESLRTDAQFLYTPPQIALACIRHYDENIVQLFVETKFPDGMGGEELGQKLFQAVVECETLIVERLGAIARRDEKKIEALEAKLARCKEVLDSMPPAKRKVDLPDEREAKKLKST